ncbi:MAG: hypothetical protein O3C45_08680 [Bacteroidetes bacterium]|nr:hypothetical protein [Bacteroidota bacterium]
MLIKILFLSILVWWIFRAAGNLIAVARGQQQPLDPPRTRPYEAYPPQEDEPPIRVVRKPGAPAPKTPPASDVEDARFRDI